MRLFAFFSKYVKNNDSLFKYIKNEEYNEDDELLYGYDGNEFYDEEDYDSDIYDDYYE